MAIGPSSNSDAYRGLPPRTVTALVEATTAINASLDLNDVLQAVAQTAAVVLRSEASSVLILDQRRNKLVFMKPPKLKPFWQPADPAIITEIAQPQTTWPA